MRDRTEDDDGRMAAKSKITKDKAGEYRFKLNAPNGETIAVSEGYKTKSSAKKGIDRVKMYAGMRQSTTRAD